MASYKKPLTIALCALALTATSFATSTAISIAFPTNLQAQTADPASSRAKETQADTLVTQQKYKEALPLYEEALTLGSTRPASEQRTLRRKIANTNSRKKEARGDRLLTKNKYKRANSVYRAALKAYEEALTLGSTRPATEKQALQAKVAKAFSLLREKKGDTRMAEGKHGRALLLYERALAEGRGRTATELLAMTSKKSEAEGNRAAKRGNFKEALRSYRESSTLAMSRSQEQQTALGTKITNTNSKMKEKKGDELTAKGKHVEALKSYQQAASLASARPEAERTALQTKIAIAPTRAKEAEADALVVAGNNAGALTKYQEALAASTDRPQEEKDLLQEKINYVTSVIKEGEGDTHVTNGEHSDALVDFNEALRLGTGRDAAELLLLRGKISIATSRIKEAEGDAHVVAGDHSDALVDFNTALTGGTGRPAGELTALRGKIAIATSRVKEAEGDAHVTSGDHSDALVDFNAALTAGTDRPSAELTALRAKIAIASSRVKEAEGDAHVTNNEHSAALADFQEALRLGTGRPSAELTALRGKITTAEAAAAAVTYSSLGAIRHWTFDENEGTTATDGINHARMSLQGATFGTGKRGAGQDTGLVFETVSGGTDHHANVGSTSVSGAWSVGMWINSKGGNWRTLITTSDNWLVRSGQGDGRVGLTQVGVADHQHATYSIPANQWVYLVIVRSGSSTSFYVGGTLRATINQGFDLNLTSISNGTTGGFEGSIDDLVIFNKALNTTQIASLETVAAKTVAYVLPEPPMITAYTPLDPIRHWTFDENEGVTATDGINQVQMSFQGASWGTGRRTGMDADSGLALDTAGGSFDYADVGATSVSGAWSIGMWINKTAGSGSKTLIHNSDGWVIKASQANGRVGVTQLMVEDHTHSSYSLPTNQWVYLVIVRSGATISFYVNGTLRATINQGFDLDINSISSGTVDGFDGSIDDLVVFDKALNTTQIAALQTAAASTVAYSLTPTFAQPRAVGVIPRLKNWTSGTGTFTLSSSTKLTYSTTDGALSKNSQTQPALSAQTLAEVATLFKAEILEQEEITVTIETASSLAAGNIHFALDSSLADVGAEGYTMDIDSDRILITARTSTGAFYATRTLLQMLKISDDQTILVGDVKDYPDYPIRQIMLDQGRKYWTVDYLKDLIRDMSYKKMNSFYMHIVEGNAFRIYSDKAAFKGLSNPDVSLNKAEIEGLVAFGKKYHVDLIPGLEFPSHASPVSKTFDIGFGGHCTNLVGDSSTYPLADDYTMDMTDPRSLTVAGNLLDEFVPWFNSPYVHSGGDEVPATLASCPYVQNYISSTSDVSSLGDLLIRFTNGINTKVKSLGKRLMVFNGFEGLSSPLQDADTDIIIMHWEGSGLVHGHTDHDHIIGGPPGAIFLTPNYHHHIYPTPASLFSWNLSPSRKILGPVLMVWTDFSYSGDDKYFEDLLIPRRAPIANRGWNKKTTPGDSYAKFSEDYSKIGRHVGYEGFTETRVNDGVPTIRWTFDRIEFPFGFIWDYKRFYFEDTKDRLPGTHYATAAATPPVVDGRLDGAMTIGTGNDGVGLGGANMKAPWTLTFWYNGNDTRPHRGLLSHHAEQKFIKMRGNDSGKIALKEGSTYYSWNYTAPNSQWTHIAIVAKSDGMSDLYVNGTRHSAINKTIDLPLGAVGEGARGSHNVRATLDEMMVFDEALTAAQIQAIRKVNQPINRWTFNEYSGTSSSDGAPTNEISITLGGATLKTRDADTALPLRLTGSSLLFDGTNDRATFASNVTTTGTGWTISLWLHPKSVTTAQTLMDFATAATNPFLAITTTGRLSIYGTAFNAYTLTADKWVYLSFVRNGTSITLYVNGVSKGSVTVSSAAILAVKYLGASAGTASRFFTGLVDEISVYSSAFTAAEAKMLYNIESPPIKRKK